MRRLAISLLAFTALVSPALSRGASSSGGFSHPSFSAPHVNSPSFSSPSRPSNFGSGGDSAIDRSLSGSSYRNYTAPAPITPVVPVTSRNTSLPYSAPHTSQTYDYTWSSRRRYQPPVVIVQSPAYNNPSWASYWIMMETMSAIDRERYDREHSSDAEYQSWRTQAAELAKSDPVLADRLKGKDADEEPSHAAFYFEVAVAALLGGGTSFYVLYSLAKRRERVPAVQERTSVLAHAADNSSKLKVGQVLSVDPTYFVLNGNDDTVPPTEDEHTIVRIDGIEYFCVPHTRAWVSDTKRFELHYTGSVDQCRYYNKIDQVTPTNAEEWSFWLDPEDGAIGAPQFKDKRDVVYDRAWAPSSKWLDPGKPETMLYVCRNGADRYILLEVVEGDRVDVWSGIDVRPESLDL